MGRVTRLGVLVPIFLASFLGSAAWNFTERLTRRAEVREQVNLRYDNLTTRRLKEIMAIEKQDKKKAAEDGEVILEYEGVPPRPLTYNDISGKPSVPLAPPVPPRKE